MNHGLASSTSTSTSAGTLTRLGIPLTFTLAIATALGTDSANRPLLYVGLYGNPAQLVIIDVEEERVLEAFPLPKSVLVNTIKIAPDGLVYLATGGDGHLFTYNPATNQVSDLGRVFQEQMIYDLAIGENGTVYGCTYKSCKLFQYTPENGFEELAGPLVPGEMYAQKMAWEAGSQQAYVGIGSHAHLVKVDLEARAVVGNLLPDMYKSSSTIETMELFFGKLFVRVVPGFEFLVIDTATDTVEMTIPRLDAYLLAASPVAREVYFQIGNVLHKYDVDKLDYESLNIDLGAWLTRGAGFVQLQERGFPGYTLVGLTRLGKLVKYNPQSNQLRIVDPLIPKQPVRIKSITSGPDGRIYTGGYPSGGLGIYDPISGAHTFHREIGQIEAAGVLGRKLYFGVYHDAVLFEYDTDQPYLWGTNPKKLFSLNEGYAQDRPFAVLGVEEEGKVFIGSVPKYGKLQGTFSIYEPSTGQLQVEDQLVANQSVLSLAYRKGLVIGGTGIYGGLGILPSEQEAKLFVWDVARHELVNELVPVPGAKAITSLIIGPCGNVWSMAEGVLFIFDPESGQVTFRSPLFDVSYTLEGSRWFDAHLEIGYDGHVYGVMDSARAFFRIDAATKKLAILLEGDLDWLAQDAEGRFYFAQDQITLCQYKLDQV